MSVQGTFEVEPWSVREASLNLDVLAQTESVFALANGHIGLRANLDEGEPYGLPGTYLNSFYELRPLPYAEGGFGYPESGQTIVNVTNGKIIRLLVDDAPFDVRYGHLLAHERVLDLRAGVLRRSLEWASPAGARVQIRSTRLVSFAQRTVARFCTRSSRSTPLYASSRSRSWSRTNRRLLGRPTRGPRLPSRRRSSRKSSPITKRGSCWCTRRSAAVCAWRREWITSSKARTERRLTRRARRTSAA